MTNLFIWFELVILVFRWFKYESVWPLHAISTYQRYLNNWNDLMTISHICFVKGWGKIFRLTKIDQYSSICVTSSLAPMDVVKRSNLCQDCSECLKHKLLCTSF